MTKNKHLIENYSGSWSDDSLRLYSTPSNTARQLYFYVQEAGYFKTKPSYFTERENLVSFLILHTISGEGKLVYENAEYTITKGQTFWIDCREQHKYRCASGKGWEFVWVHFYGNNALGYYNEFRQSSSSVVLTPDNPSVIENEIRNIVGMIEHRNIHSEIRCSESITKLLTELTIQNSTSVLAEAVVPDYIKNALKYIEQNISNPLSLDEIAGNAGISKFYLSKQFKRYIGQSVVEYITASRLNNAKELLRSTDLSVNEIALYCGIPHVTHFINLFKREEQLTPHVYRKYWKT